MDFSLPDHLPGVLADMDEFIEVEIKPLEREHIQYFDHRREHARTESSTVRCATSASAASTVARECAPGQG